MILRRAIRALPFKARISKFVSDLRLHYPAARFFLALGPMLSEIATAGPSVYLKAVIAARTSAGDKKPDPARVRNSRRGRRRPRLRLPPQREDPPEDGRKLLSALKADLGW